MRVEPENHQWCVALTKYHTRGLRIIEVEKAHLGDLPAIVDQVRSAPFQFLIYCDDLTFEDGEREYSGLKTVLDGTLEEFGYYSVVCTSNRRHLVSEPMSDNQYATVVNGEIHQGDAIEERVSLSDRFGLALLLSIHKIPILRSSNTGTTSWART